MTYIRHIAVQNGHWCEIITYESFSERRCYYNVLSCSIKNLFLNE